MPECIAYSTKNWHSHRKQHAIQSKEGMETIAINPKAEYMSTVKCPYGWGSNRRKV